jgi:nitroimidazol reductase NimA-like FMN-containing flavoprotein (pyridoxamine 5'-phosphate oxidase superfamily)
MSETTAADLNQMAREVLDSVRYVVLGTIDEDGRTRTSPVYFVPHGYQNLYWVSNPDSHHSHNLQRDNRVSGVVFDSTVSPGPDTRAVYVTGAAREIPAEELEQHLPHAFDSARDGRAFSVEELSGDADIRLWVFHVDSWEVHIRGSHPGLGTGTDRRMPVDPRA